MNKESFNESAMAQIVVGKGPFKIEFIELRVIDGKHYIEGKRKPIRDTDGVSPSDTPKTTLTRG